MRIIAGTNLRATTSADSRSFASRKSRERRMAAAWASTPAVASMALPLGIRKLRPNPSATSRMSPFLPTESTTARSTIFTSDLRVLGCSHFGLRCPYHVLGRVLDHVPDLHRRGGSPRWTGRGESDLAATAPTAPADPVGGGADRVG